MKKATKKPHLPIVTAFVAWRCRHFGSRSGECVVVSWRSVLFDQRLLPLQLWKYFYLEKQAGSQALSRIVRKPSNFSIHLERSIRNIDLTY